MSNLHLYDFGIFIQLLPDEEEKAMLENNIQMAIQQKSIELEDAIDLREIKSIKLANQLLKIRRKNSILWRIFAPPPFFPANLTQ